MCFIEKKFQKGLNFSGIAGIIECKRFETNTFILTFKTHYL